MFLLCGCSDAKWGCSALWQPLLAYLCLKVSVFSAAMFNKVSGEIPPTLWNIVFSEDIEAAATAHKIHCVCEMN